MSQTVTRLKELLFDNEAQALADLSRRLDQVAETQQTSRAALQAELDAMMARVGNSERLTESVAEIIDEALRLAEVNKHSELSQSIAPLVITTIKAELKNSQDEMVEALYPITGRLVKAYVASAIKDLAEDMNRRLEQNPVMLRLQSLATGRSVGELALASTQKFKILELYLIRRGSGELVAHWPREASGREHLVSGVLAAVNAFANEAFEANEGSLRQIDLGEETVYLRGSQLYLLAAKCSGTAPAAIEQTLDDAFLSTIEKKLDAPDDAAAANSPAKLINDLGTEVTARVEDRQRALRRRGGGPLKILATLILLPLLGWLGWSAWVNFANEQTRDGAVKIIAATEAMQGYPASIEASNAGRSLRLSGLTPSQSIKDHILRNIALLMPKVTVRDELTVVPGSDITIPDTEPKFDEVRKAVRDLQSETERSVIQRLSSRTERRLMQAQADLKAAAATESDAAKSPKLAQAAASAELLAKDISKLSANLTDTAAHGEPKTVAPAVFDAFTQRLARESSTLADVMGAAKEKAPSEESPNALVALEALAAVTERYAGLAAVAATASSLKPVHVNVPVPVEKPAPPPSARARLQEFIARNAVFFGNAAEYRDEQAARRTFDAIVPLLREANVLVRVVGYTDVAGTVPGNVSLAQTRADRVREELLSRGAPPALLVAVGRRDTIDLSPAQGIDSPNRRVVFELGYDGEAGR